MYKIKSIILFLIILSLSGCAKVVGHNISFKYAYVDSFSISGTSPDGEKINLLLEKHELSKDTNIVDCKKVILKIQNKNPETLTCKNINDNKVELSFDFPKKNKTNTGDILFLLKNKEFTSDKKLITNTFTINQVEDGLLIKMAGKLGQFLRGLYAAY